MEILRIREEQIWAFEQEEEKAYRRSFAALLPGVWPELCAKLGPDGVQGWVDLGFQRAREHRIHKRENLTRYVHLMFMLGDKDFDRNPALDWAATLLGWGGKEGLKLAALEKRARDQGDA